MDSSTYDVGKTGGSLGLTRKRLLGEQRNHRKYEWKTHILTHYFELFLKLPINNHLKVIPNPNPNPNENKLQINCTSNKSPQNSNQISWQNHAIIIE
jgi:hypothetical protein